MNPVLFKRNTTIRHKRCGRLYLVNQTPETCLHNGVASYQLTQIGLQPKTPPFIRTQRDVELDWEELTIPGIVDLIDSSQLMFSDNELLEDANTKQRFVVSGLPTHHRMANTNESAYVYQGADGIRMVLAQSDMEDGRFVKVDQSNNLPEDTSK